MGAASHAGGEREGGGEKEEDDCERGQRQQTAETGININQKKIIKFGRVLAGEASGLQVDRWPISLEWEAGSPVRPRGAD